ncbi:MAG: HAD family hydrolase [Desulfovibrio sp.]|nr:HAD family hydrolase [Desulfovibrio sp.]
MALSCLVFDCDGVLLDSVPVKTRAFARLVEDYGPSAQARFVEFHKNNGGVSRYDKFAWFFQNVLGRPITDAEKAEFATRFADICHEELLKCAEIKGARTVLETFYKVLPLYVCSGAPKAEQSQILEEHHLAQFFKGIYGSPPAKAVLLAQILEEAKIQPNQALMVGDATTDRDAAQKVGTMFYGVGELLRGGNHPWGPDLSQLVDFIKGQGLAC